MTPAPQGTQADGARPPMTSVQLADIKARRAETVEVAALACWPLTEYHLIRQTLTDMAVLLTEVERLRADRDACHDWADTLAYKVAPVEVLGRHGEKDQFPWGDALDLITPAAEVERLRARAAELEAAVARVLAPHTQYANSPHCEADGDSWPCFTVKTLAPTGRPLSDGPAPHDPRPGAEVARRLGTCPGCGDGADQWCPDCACCHQGCFGGHEGNPCTHPSAPWNRNTTPHTYA